MRRKEVGGAAPANVPPIVHQVLGDGGRPIEDDARAWMEQRFGRDFSDVRVHDDARAAESSQAVGALAYTVGRHVIFDQHQYAPRTPAGRRLLAHELAHTLQDPATGLHASLAIGQPDDPAEIAADRAADAAMRGEGVSVSLSVGGVVRRQMRECAATPGDSPYMRNVACPDGGRYRVTMSLSPGPTVPAWKASATPGANLQGISLDIEVCKGDKQVNIVPTVGVDIPSAAGSIIANLVAGSDAMKGIPITPSLTFTFVQSKNFSVSLEPSVTADDTGVTGGGIKGEVQTKDFTVAAGVACGPPNNTCLFTIGVGGGKAPKHVNCDKSTKWMSFTCEKLRQVPGTPERPAKSDTDTQTRHVFFEYAKSEIRRDFGLPTDIPALLKRGYRVTSITGSTSPEGPRGTEHAPYFEGNEALSEKRAEAACAWLGDPKICPGDEANKVHLHFAGELPPEQGKRPETRGRAMEHEAVAEFLGNAGVAVGKAGVPDAMAPSDPESRAKFERMPFNKQRNQAFELMRRAAIVLQRTYETQKREPATPAREEHDNVACSPQVEEAARKSYGIKTPGPLNFDWHP